MWMLQSTYLFLTEIWKQDPWHAHFDVFFFASELPFSPWKQDLCHRQSKGEATLRDLHHFHLEGFTQLCLKKLFFTHKHRHSNILWEYFYLTICYMLIFLIPPPEKLMWSSIGRILVPWSRSRYNRKEHHNDFLKWQWYYPMTKRNALVSIFCSRYQCDNHTFVRQKESTAFAHIMRMQRLKGYLSSHWYTDSMPTVLHTKISMHSNT